MTGAARPSHRPRSIPVGYSSGGCSPSIARLCFADDARISYCPIRGKNLSLNGNSVLTVCLSRGGRRSRARRPSYFAACPQAQGRLRCCSSGAGKRSSSVTASAPVWWTVERIAISTASKSSCPVLWRSAKIRCNCCSICREAFSQAAAVVFFPETAVVPPPHGHGRSSHSLQ